MTETEQRTGSKTAVAWLIAVVMLLAALSLWTVIPLVWLWIGDHDDYDLLIR